jgi:two-component system, LytTR family, response regulator
MMRAMIVDDEIYARRSLETMLTATEEFQVVSVCANAVEALQSIKVESPDVLFLDVQMPKVNGFQLLSMIGRERMPSVVFVTAFDEFAIKAFEENAIDYLLKPVLRERLTLTVEKLKRVVNEGRTRVYDSPKIDRIPCTGPSCIRLVDVDEVEHVHCSAAGVYVVTPKGEFLTELTMQVLENKTQLERCHRQYLVDVRQIEEIHRPEPRAAVLKMKSGHEVPVSRRFFAALRHRLGLRRDLKYIDPLS